MKKFIVYMGGLVHSSASVIVEAETKEEAEDKAFALTYCLQLLKEEYCKDLRFWHD